MDLSWVVATRKAAANWKGLLAGFSLVLLVSQATAKVPPAAGSSSSASIEIKVSVVQRYRLKAMEETPDRFRSANAPAGPFCIASNGADMVLPAELVFAGPAGREEAAKAEVATRIPVVSCDAAGLSRRQANEADLLRSARMVIVRPE